MLLFIEIREKLFLVLGNSNTSHVIVYHHHESVHMLLLKYSNTSHVIVYPSSVDIPRPMYLIQIHLMLLFIRSAPDSYISSHFIQIHLMLLFIAEVGFNKLQLQVNSNTSHVIVYRNLTALTTDEKTFKYISCYCLS